MEESTVSLPRAEELTESPEYTAPAHLTTFSYSDKRKLLLPSSARQDESLRFYKEPPRQADLRRGYNDCGWRDESIVEGLDSLLECLMELPVNEATDQMLNTTNVITWRGMMTRLCTCAYEEKEGWELDAQLVNGTLYLEDHATAASLAAKADMKPDHRLQSYFGYSFESYCTKERPDAAARDWAGTPNTNEQWCSIVKARMGDVRLIIGGEVDCIAPDADLQNPSTASFIELKTNMVVHDARDIMRFEKYKLLKFYMQSFLLGVPRIIVGFRTREGMLNSVQSFDTLEIPNLFALSLGGTESRSICSSVKEKPHAWHPSQALQYGYTIMVHAINTIAASHVSQQAEQRLTQFAASNEDFLPSQWASLPLFRIRFQPAVKGEQAQLTIRLVPEEERMDRPGTLGVVTAKWFESVIERMRRGHR